MSGFSGQLVARRRVSAPTLVLAGLMLALSVFAAVLGGAVVAWIGALLFGAAFAALLVGRLRPVSLVISPNAFEVSGTFGGATTYELSDCGRFSVFRQALPYGQRADWLVFDHVGSEPGTWLKRKNSTMTGANTQLRVDGFDRSPEEIADVLNDLRSIAGRDESS